MVYFTKYTIIGHFIDLSMHKKVNDKPTATNWIESLNLTTYLHVSSIFTFYIIIFTSILYLCGKLIKMTETLNMKINENFVSQKRTGKRFFSNI